MKGIKMKYVEKRDPAFDSDGMVPPEVTGGEIKAEVDGSMYGGGPKGSEVTGNAQDEFVTDLKESQSARATTIPKEPNRDNSLAG